MAKARIDIRSAAGFQFCNLTFPLCILHNEFVRSLGDRVLHHF
jgi:hypothetical protein